MTNSVPSAARIPAMSYGSSSRGPSVLGGGDGGEDDIPEAPFLETTLVDKGHTRVRVASTLEISADGEEGDGALRLLRTIVTLERWMKPSRDGLGEEDEEALEKISPEEGALSHGEYLNPRAVCGRWKLFTRIGSVLPASSDSDSDSDAQGAGEDGGGDTSSSPQSRHYIVAYSTEESEVQREPELSTEGDISLWLTRGVSVSLDFDESGSNLCYRVGLCTAEGQRLEMTRVYDADSCELLEVRHADEIDCDWSGAPVRM